MSGSVMRWAVRKWQEAPHATYYLNGKGETDPIGFQESLIAIYAERAANHPDKAARRRFARSRDEATARADALRRTRPHS